LGAGGGGGAAGVLGAGGATGAPGGGGRRGEAGGRGERGGSVGAGERRGAAAAAAAEDARSAALSRAAGAFDVPLSPPLASTLSSSDATRESSQLHSCADRPSPTYDASTAMAARRSSGAARRLERRTTARAQDGAAQGRRAAAAAPRRRGAGGRHAHAARAQTRHARVRGARQATALGAGCFFWQARKSAGGQVPTQEIAGAFSKTPSVPVMTAACS
jgi:hypothetical protein